MSFKTKKSISVLLTLMDFLLYICKYKFLLYLVTAFNLKVLIFLKHYNRINNEKLIKLLN